MQKIVHPEDYKYVHPIFSDIERLYVATSERRLKQQTLVPKVYDSSFGWLCDLFAEFGGFTDNFSFVDKKYQPLELPKYDPKNIILCFSGGKDSLAASLYYKEQGYNVYLYYLKSVNPIFDEFTIAEKLAEKLELPLFVDEVKVSGHHEWIEHPMKNMIIANGALAYGIQNNIGTKIAFGNYRTSTLYDDEFSYCGGDDVEMWCAYEEIINRIIPDFSVDLCLENLGVTLDTVCKHKDLLDYTISCLGRAGLRDYRHSWVKDKFDIDLPKHRCGSCYKCAVEYIYMADHDLQKYSADYYKYCIDRLRLDAKRETGEKLPIDRLWERYFFYDRNESKYLQEHKDVV